MQKLEVKSTHNLPLLLQSKQYVLIDDIFGNLKYLGKKTSGPQVCLQGPTTYQKTVCPWTPVSGGRAPTRHGTPDLRSSLCPTSSERTKNFGDGT